MIADRAFVSRAMRQTAGRTCTVLVVAAVQKVLDKA